MTVAQILYNTTTGRILSSSLGTISVVPAGHAVIARDVASFTGLSQKQVSLSTLQPVDMDYLEIDGGTEFPIATVQGVGFTKRNGETNALMAMPTDNETVRIGLRQPDESYFFNLDQEAFLDVESVQLVDGAGSVKVATGVAPGNEVLVLHHDTLVPVFARITYE